MFDIGFTEIIVCCVVALVVIGPERMPEAVRSIGLWVGRFKRSLRETREEIERQIGVDDIRRQLHNEDIMRTLENTRADINRMIEESQNSLDVDMIERNKTHTYEHNELPDHSHTVDTSTQTQESIVEQLPIIEPAVTHDNIIAPEPVKTSL